MSDHNLWSLTSHVRRGLDKIRKKRLEDRSIDENILLFGTPRSGSTWLMEILRAIPGYSSVMEPLHIKWFPKIERLGIQPRTYKNIDCDWKEGKRYFKNLLHGRIINKKPHFSLRPIPVLERILSDKLVIKFVRGNRLLPWISASFPDVKKILLIRHPCAVINSQMRTGFTGYNPCEAWGKDRYPTRKQIIDEIKKMDFLDDNIKDKVKEMDNKEELLAVT